MKLSSKIALLAGLSSVLSAGAALFVGRAVLVESLLASHFIAEKDMLNSVADRLSAAAESGRRGARAGAARFAADGKPKRPRQTPSAKKSGGYAELDVLPMWRDVKPHIRGKDIFAVDTDGRLVAHDDEARVAAASDFSGLEAVSEGALRRRRSDEALITLDEKARKSVAVWADGPADIVIFSLTPYEDVMRPLAKMTAKAGAWAALIAAIFAAAGIFFARRITTPLERLRAAAIEVSRGKLDFDGLEIPSADEEVASLAKDFAAMTEALKKLMGLRDDLVHMIVHDLKSPLSAIVSSIEFLNSDAQSAGNDKQLKFLRLARSSSKNLMRLIEDMLDVAKLEHGKLRPVLSDVSVKSLLETSMRDFEAQASAEKKILSLRCPDGLRAICDEALMRRVVSNLLSNAMKHTKTDTGAIEVEAKSDGISWTLTVSDNGMGVPEEYLSKIFDKFVQVEGRRFQIRSGAGLGLTFSKLAAEAHGGEISVASQEGKGSSFSVKLPFSAVQL
ncbi:MAG: hypothetical protein CVU77_06895 [Elusimicrobia bacterium HGW-Elusimicrobia-1]|nr:MAG: hypothetical protein CVU77_06895 [Elusimicrobia bacterium HGW-Elusimicrobia-1]